MSPPGAVSFQRFLVRTAGLKRHYYDVSCTLPSYGFESVWSNGLCPLEEFCKEEYVNYQENVLPFPQNCNAPQNTTWILTIGMNSLFDLYHFSLLFLHDYANFTFINKQVEEEEDMAVAKEEDTKIVEADTTIVIK